MVRLKDYKNPEAIKAYKNFNSKMVRLKGEWKTLDGDEYKNFNSKMVRLKDKYIDELQSLLVKFQFQNGSIKSLIVSRLKQLIVYFNSKMVRLKDGWWSGIESNLMISIPKWFD